MTAFGVSVEDLTGHAARLDALAEEVGAATEAISSASLGAEAYGQLGSPVASRLNALQEAGLRSMTNTIEGIVVAATEIREAAAEYAATEQDNTQRIEDSGD